MQLVRRLSFYVRLKLGGKLLCRFSGAPGATM